MQIRMFDGKNKYDFNKQIRLIELFGGIGCQAKALENLNVEFEHYRLCDFDKYAVQSYNAVHGTNFVPTDITQLKAEDLGIEETDKYDYIMTYSFPCQSLSLAGKQEGMARDGGTRSGLLWEVERLLNECHELPQILLMENVPQVHGKKNIDNFNEWCTFLESKGYKNYYSDLNAKNYGIPQNRNRTFMVSLLGDYVYEFPKAFELKLRLRDMLEDDVDEKYYLSKKALNGIIPTLCARDYKDPKLVLVAQLDGFESRGIVYGEEGLAPTINTMGGGNREPKIAELIPFGSYYTWPDNKGNINTQCNRACDADNILLTIPTIAGHTKVVEKQNLKRQLCNKLIEENRVKENDVIRHSYSNSRMDKMYIQNNINHDCAPTLDTRCDCLGVAINNEQLRIRKLVPLECWRLMGLSDEDFNKAKASGMSNAQLYKQAGNGIVVNVLMEIFRKLLGDKK